MAAERILDSTNNILALYQYHVGESQIPPDYHTWCCLAGVAACVADRVWYTKFKWSKTTPALFTFLLGPSAVGKGDAIDVLTPYLDGIPAVNQFVGDITPEAMLEMMGGPPIKGPKGKAGPDRSKIFLVTEELAGSIGEGPAARNFIRKLTQLYKRGATKFQHKTVTSANASVPKHNINWLAGSTIEWMIDSIPPSAIRGGFIGRIIPVMADYDFDHRIFEPTSPHDYDEVRDHLFRRFEALTRLEGEFRMTKLAKRIHKHWFHNRPSPTNPLLYATWIRMDDMAIKLSMDFSLCESHQLVIRARHMELALRAIAGSYHAVKTIIRASSQTGDTKAVEVVAGLIRRHKMMREASLLSRAGNEGVGRRATIDAIMTLQGTKQIEKVKFTNKKGRLVDIAYEWLPRRVF